MNGKQKYLCISSPLLADHAFLSMICSGCMRQPWLKMSPTLRPRKTFLTNWDYAARRQCTMEMIIITSADVEITLPQHPGIAQYKAHQRMNTAM